MNKLFKKIVSIWYEGTVEEIIDDWKWIFSYSRKHKLAIVFYIVLGIFNTTVALGGAIVSKYLVDIITGYQSEKLTLLLCIMIGSSIGNIILRNLILRLSTKISIFVRNDISADIFDRIIDSDWLAISKYSSGDILARFNGDVSSVSENCVNWLPSIIISIYHFVATFIVIFHYDPIMAFIALASAPALLLVSKIVLRKQREYNKQLREVNSKMVSFESETFYNFDTIKSFGILDQYSRKMKEWQNTYKTKALERNSFVIKTNIYMQTVAGIVSLTAFCYCLYRLWTHDITYGTMTLFLSQRGALSSAFDSIVRFIPNMLMSSVSAHRVRELIDLPKEVHLPESERVQEFADEGISVNMKEISYAYEEGKPVLEESSFKANPGEIVALVGPSGEGKTTMIRMILSLIHPDLGSVTLESGDGHVAIPANADTRRYFAYVPQGNTIVSGTIADNLRMAKEDATDKEMEEALKTACAWDFVSNMPEGIYSGVGERGRGLSEGQAQRIAIARAVLKDSPVLLLDEATSALDVKTERAVLRGIIRQHPNKTCIVTTHRPSVLNLCERVYRVMDKKITLLSDEDAQKMAMDF